jgi:hypothetical protein
MLYKTTHTIAKFSNRIIFVTVLRYCLFAVCMTPIAAHAVDITFTKVKEIVEGTQQVSWDAFGQRWNALVNKDTYLGEKITIVDVAVSTANEQFNREIDTHCYYRGSLTDDAFNPIPDTHAYFNLCDHSIPFVGFVSNQFNVYTIARSDSSPKGIDMVIDNQNQAVPYEGISPHQGEPNNNIPDGLYPRRGKADLFPSIEIAVEPAYVAKYGEDVFIDRILETLAFANSIYKQSGMQQLSLVAISLLDQNVIWSGGSGSVRSNIHNLRWRTAQPTSADMILVYLGSNVNTNELWGWGELGYACDLQRAVAEGWNLNSNNIGRSSGYLTPLPSLIQRGWLMAHEAGHILNSGHVKQDPLMDGNFLYLPALADYKAGCTTISDIYKTCTYSSKNRKFTDFYNCD